MSNTKEKASINWHLTCQLTYVHENVKYRLTVWKIKNMLLMIKSDMREKVNDLVRLHEAMQGKLKTASHSEQIQIFLLVPGKWSRMHSSKYCNVFEYLVWTSHQTKKSGETLATPATKKKKNYHHWNTSSGNKRFWRWQFQ